MKIIVCWLWGNKYPAEYAYRLARGFKRNLHQSHRFAIVADQQINGKGSEVWELKDKELLQYGFGTIARMRLFDNEWQRQHGINIGDQIVNVDVDTIVTGLLDGLLNRHDEFTILQNINSTNPNPFNGSFWMVQAGTRSDVWNEFNVELWRSIPRHAKLSDQDWLRYKFPLAAAWGPDDGVYGFKKRGWSGWRDDLPDNAKVVTFPGRDPDKYANVPWIRKHWILSQ